MFDLPQGNTPEARKKSVETTKCEITIAAYIEAGGIGMGLLSDGSPYLTQRGLAVLCGVRNAHIGTIGRDWATVKPRIRAIKAHLGRPCASPHHILNWQGHRQYVYSVAVCEAVLAYYAVDAGDHIQPEARSNRLKFRSENLEAFIRRQITPRDTRRLPLRFRPVHNPTPEIYEAIDAAIAYVCGLFALSAWLANTYIDGLRQRAMNAPWNRLGLYLPLKAILEIQAEALLRINGTFTVR
ncbi:MAG: hypothetical protein QM647_04840 [Asticcacaulis sp.]|uniref:hypothetical protein n=1 Tax=Asticcacaulis sp. TaxID=1872648 RepID=UPI0039E4ECF2